LENFSGDKENSICEFEIRRNRAYRSERYGFATPMRFAQKGASPMIDLEGVPRYRTASSSERDKDSAVSINSEFPGIQPNRSA